MGYWIYVYNFIFTKPIACSLICLSQRLLELLIYLLPLPKIRSHTYLTKGFAFQLTCPGHTAYPLSFPLMA